ncbi:hypothetical protein FALBO_5977 [Fusarium albosuccineum]|uniref:Chromo shadow domain-containing protein n=1 Tax=Fusarium albosuccineum TaxID=1237068 RepID=A0A8H4LE69_9HYPO|nr:hypothetical protein FALBO_5977 [Fusarium albosuccineum]
MIEDYLDKCKKKRRRTRKPNVRRSNRNQTDSVKTDEVSRSKPRRSRDTALSPPSQLWTPPRGSWETEIDTIDCVEDAGNETFVFYVSWKGGQKTKHTDEILREKCPKKVRNLVLA